MDLRPIIFIKHLFHRSKDRGLFPFSLPSFVLFLCVNFSTHWALSESHTSATPQGETSATPQNEVDFLGIGDGQIENMSGNVGQIVEDLRELESVNLKQAKTLGIQLQDEFSRYQSARKLCIQTQKIAGMACLEKLSPELAEGAAGINMVASTIGMANTTDTCSKIGNILGLATKAMTAFTAACGAAQASCTAGCSSAVGLVGKIKSTRDQINRLQNPIGIGAPDPTNQHVKDSDNLILTRVKEQLKELSETLPKIEDSSDDRTPAGKLRACNVDYKKQLASAALGMLNYAKGLEQSSKCKNQSDGTGRNCADPAQASTPACICEKNPRLAGCVNNLEKSNSVNSMSPSTGTADSSTNPNEGNINLGNNTGDKPFTNEKNSGAPGDAGGLTGGYANGSPLGSDSAAGGSGKTDAAKVGNSNEVKVTEGSLGGGRGGAGSMGFNFGSDYGVKKPLTGDRKVQAERSIAAAQFRQEVTAGGGLTNWEKIRSRYQENRHTFLNGALNNPNVRGR